MKYNLTKLIIALIIPIIGITLLSGSALASSSFDPGRIIDDEIFYDKDAMGSAQDIQRFIVSHTSVCDTWGTSSSGYGNLNRAQYATQVKKWHGPPYVCLQNYHENPSTGETSFEKGGGAFSGGVNVGRMVWDAAQEYSINPQVLLVLLRKESAGPLFADSWPLKSQYTYAMGYGCPDSGPGYSANCNSNQGGFYKQMKKAAAQLRMYRDNINNYNYQPGRVNRILYNPNPSCGTQDVYIKNYATASLYIYTPYVPNAAALAAFPGEASCGAYGNRNFWHFFKEWFGSTTIDSNFYRTTNNATVYLVSGDVKYPVSNPSLIDAAAPLGKVSFTSQSYLDGLKTGSGLDRLIRSPDGTVYLFDAGIKLPFASCNLVEEYGYTCGESLLLTESQINSFHSGPRVTNGIKTTSGKTFYISAGKKREVLNDKSLKENGISVAFNVLNEGVLQKQQYGIPIVGKGSTIEDRQSPSSKYLNLSEGVFTLSSFHTATPVYKNSSVGRLDKSSINMLSKPKKLEDLLRDDAGRLYLITKDGKREVTDRQSFANNPETQLSSASLSLIQGNGKLTSPTLLKSMSNGTVYAVVNGEKRPLLSMSDLQSIVGSINPYIAWTSDQLVNRIKLGNIIVRVASMVKTPSSATVYMTDGYDTLIPMSSFVHTDEIGVKGGIATISDSVLSKYNVVNKSLTSYIKCGADTYLGMGGVLYGYHFSNHTPTVLTEQTCNALNRSNSNPKFVIDSVGTIYQVNGNVVNPIGGWNTYLRLNTTNSKPVNVNKHTISYFNIGKVL